jgi:ferrous iron transport protein A
LTAFPSNLAQAAIGDNFTVSGVVSPVDNPEWASQLQDIGFLPGEHVAVMARGLPGGDPLVVRIGLSTFALRRVEAACVQVVSSSVPAA